MAQHNELSNHTSMFVPLSNLLLQNAMLALHQMQKVKQTDMVPVCQVSIGLDLSNENNLLHENRKRRT